MTITLVLRHKEGSGAGGEDRVVVCGYSLRKLLDTPCSWCVNVGVIVKYGYFNTDIAIRRLYEL